MTEESQEGPIANVVPHLVVKGAADALEFYKRAFGMEETLRLTSPGGDSVAHAELRHGKGTICLADEFPQCRGPEALGGSPVTIHLQVADVDGAFQRAVDAGAEAVMPPADMFWGDRYGRLRCPFGHEWSMAQHVRDVSMEEMEEGLKRAFAESPGG